MTIVLIILLGGGTICAVGTGSFVWSMIRDELEARRAKRETPQDDLDTAEIRRQAISAELVDVRVARSPLLSPKPAPRPAAPRLRVAEVQQQMRIEQQVRRANVVIATGMTAQFNRIIEASTGTPPRGRGPREADLQAWQQLDLFAEVS